MINKVLTDKLDGIANDLAAEHGEFDLFGVFLRQESDARWELVAAAPWLPRPQRQFIDLISRKLTEKLTIDELMKISAIIIVSSADAGFHELAKTLRGRALPMALTDFEAFGMEMDHAYIMRFNPPRANGSQRRPARTRNLSQP